MDRGTVFGLLSKHVAETLEIDHDEITEDSLMIEDLGADSIDLLNLVLVLKDEFNIEINDGEVKELLRELAVFLPEGTIEGELTDERLGEITREMRVGTIVDFITTRIAMPQ